MSAGGDILFTAAGLFIFLAVEAFTNDLGGKVAPAQWADERRFFGQGRYQGTLGKLRFLAGQLDVALSTSRRPYQTVRELRRRRDRLAHGRPEVLERIVRFQDPREIQAIPPAVFAFSDTSFLERAMVDAESLCDTLQSAAQARLGQHEILSPWAFRGMIFHQISTIIEMPS
jgi:hypothetical protein